MPSDPARAHALQVSVDLLPDPAHAAGSVVVVVDVLRMTTTATVLADLGLAHLSVVADLEAARQRARQDAALLLGERDAHAPDGFDGGNSPAELSAALVRGRDAVLCTTNGSAAVEAYAAADALLLGCLRNGAAAAARALQLAASAPAGGRVRVACAGTEGHVSLDDVAGAGHIVTALARLAPAATLDDAALAARAVAAAPDLARLLASAAHGRRLLAAGFQDDVLLAAQRDVTASLMERVAGSRDGFRNRAAA